LARSRFKDIPVGGELHVSAFLDFMLFRCYLGGGVNMSP